MASSRLAFLPSVPGKELQGLLVEERLVLADPDEQDFRRSALRLHLPVADAVRGFAEVPAGRIGNPVGLSPRLAITVVGRVRNKRESLNPGRRLFVGGGREHALG